MEARRMITRSAAIAQCNNLLFQQGFSAVIVLHAFIGCFFNVGMVQTKGACEF